MKKNPTDLAKLGVAEKKRLAAKGRAAIAIVAREKRRIESSFYAMGRALGTLKDPGVLHALGHPSFSALCTSMGISVGQADRLVHIVQSFPEPVTKHLTSSKATAIIKLAGAIGGKTTPKGLLAHGTVHLSDGDTIDLKASDANRIDAVARKLAAHKKKPRRGGVAVSSEAHAFFVRFARERQADKLTSVRVDEIAAKKADGGKMRITASIADAKKLGHALIRAAR
jgi:hypothetical protein